jgi:WD40 repeat protein
MDRREFLGASAAALACTARLAADEKSAEKEREPDLVIKNHRGCLAFSPDSKVLAVANGPIGEAEGFCLIDMWNGKRLPDFEAATDVKTRIGYGWPRVLAFSPDGNRFAAGGEGYVALSDARTGRREVEIGGSLKPKRGTVHVLAFSQDSQRLFSLGGLWTLGSRDYQPVPSAYDGVAFSKDGKLLVTRSKGLFTIREYPSLRTRNEFGVTQRSGGHLEFLPDGIHLMSDLLYVKRESYFLWNIQTGEPKYVAFKHRPCCDLSDDGTLLPSVVQNTIALGRADNGQVEYVLKYSDGQEGPRFPGDKSVIDIQFSPDQRAVALSHTTGIYIWKDKDGFKASA